MCFIKGSKVDRKSVAHNPIGLKRFGWKFYFFHVSWIAVEFVVVYWQCPKTMGTSLEDVSLVIKGDKATVSKLNPVVEAVREKEGREEVRHVETIR
jgi:hypothetical protein